MDFGVALATPWDAWKSAKRAEEAGYKSAWFFDTQLLSADVFTAMGVAAVKTDRIKLGTGVLIPSNRIAPVAANAFATLNALAPGRINAGVGTGFTGRLTMGLGAYKLADMGDYIRVMQTMWQGGTSEIELEGKTRHVRFLNPEAGLINIDDPIEVHVSALGPKGRRLTADLDANWINVDFSEGFALAKAAADDMNGLYRDAGQDPAKRRKTFFIWGSVLKEGEDCDTPRVRAEAGPFSAQILHAIMETMDRGVDTSGGADDAAVDDSPIARLAAGYRELYETYEPHARYLQLHTGHLLHIREDEAPFVTGDLIQSTTITGTPEELRDRLRKLADAGYDEVVVAITPGHESMIEDWMGVFETVAEPAPAA
jgi:5,10-methylenetetrahydromethanopterin reductase